MEEALVLSTLLIPILLFFFVINYTKFRNKKKVMELCRVLNLSNLSETYTNGVPGIKIEGVYENFRIKIYQELKGKKIYKPVTTIIEIPLNIPQDFFMEIKPDICNIKTASPVITELFDDIIFNNPGSENVDFKDSDFDNNFIVKGSPDEDIRIILKPSIRQELINHFKIADNVHPIVFKQKYFTVNVKNKVFKLQKIDNFPSLPQYRVYLDIAVRLAGEIEDSL